MFGCATPTAIFAPLVGWKSILAAIATLRLGTGCKVYESPQSVEIDTSVAGFLVPIERGIAPDSCARFLYWYPGGSLAEILDKGGGQVPPGAAEMAAKYDLEVL